MLSHSFQALEIAIKFQQRKYCLVITLWIVISFVTSISLFIGHSQETINTERLPTTISSIQSVADNRSNASNFNTLSSTPLNTIENYRINNFFRRTEVTSLETNLTNKAKVIDRIKFTTNSECNALDGNLGFEAGNYDCWIITMSPPTLSPSLVKLDSGVIGFDGNYILIGDSSQSKKSPLGVNGSITLSHIHEATIPLHGDPSLHFSYLMYSHDVIHAKQNNNPLDWLEVGIISSGTKIPLDIYGNPKIDWNGYASKCRPTPWLSNSGTVTHKTISLAKYRGQTVTVYFTLHNKTDDLCNSWVFIDDIKIVPEMVITKSSYPDGPVHEGETINYSIGYTNTGLSTQTMIITDFIPFNATLLPETVIPNPTNYQNSVLAWDLGHKSPGESGQISFRVKIPLFLSSTKVENMLFTTAESQNPTSILPVPIACDTTRFWANGVTHQPPVPNPHIVQVQIPPGSNPSGMWLLMKRIDNSPPVVAGQPADLVTTSENSFGASLWAVSLTPTMVATGIVTVVTHNPRELNGVFLFDQADPPFDEDALEDIFNTTKIFTYTLDIPSVDSQTIDVLMPFMDISYLTDDLQPDNRLTTITVQFNGQTHTVVANNPNLGNGLLMTQFPFEIGPLMDSNVEIKELVVTVETEDSIYTLGPRICRPVYIENTAWLCSEQAGCISATTRNVPENFRPPMDDIYLPIILKFYP